MSAFYTPLCLKTARICTKKAETKFIKIKPTTTTTTMKFIVKITTATIQLKVE